MIESGAGDTAQFPDAMYEAVGTYSTYSTYLRYTLRGNFGVFLICDLFVELNSLRFCECFMMILLYGEFF